MRAAIVRLLMLGALTVGVAGASAVQSFGHQGGMATALQALEERPGAVRVALSVPDDRQVRATSGAIRRNGWSLGG